VGLAVPIELGAEFIHGGAAITQAQLARSGSTIVEAADSHFGLQEGELNPREGFFAKIRAAIERSDALRRQDMSFDAFLDQHLTEALTPAERRVARTMAEGFDAADTSRASARAIVAEWTGETLGSAPQSRPLGGYESLLTALMARLHDERLRLLLQAQVMSVRWSRGSVEVAGEFCGAPLALHAARLLITLPLGVLQQTPPAAARCASCRRSRRSATRWRGSPPAQSSSSSCASAASSGRR
jgi:hypothetical protein